MRGCHAYGYKDNNMKHTAVTAIVTRLNFVNKDQHMYNTCTEGKYNYKFSNKDLYSTLHCNIYVPYMMYICISIK